MTLHCHPFFSFAFTTKFSQLHQTFIILKLGNPYCNCDLSQDKLSKHLSNDLNSNLENFIQYKLSLKISQFGSILISLFGCSNKFGWKKYQCIKITFGNFTVSVPLGFDFSKRILWTHRIAITHNLSKY